ncbi:hypothetical protein AGMMS49949_03670 [Alphaproteobacteria bacterium]|nr:hypothetical protein AGMMS49949_03670 [Alphaproteobacteria bacterium]GHS96553.1 hypothetical protein AGMMS50296_2810 [Alphaproteobacteria bacterium]
MVLRELGLELLELELKLIGKKLALKLLELGREPLLLNIEDALLFWRRSS